MVKIHFRKVLKLAIPLCYSAQNFELQTTDKEKVTCNMCKLILKKRERVYNLCKCGNEKWHTSKQCQRCYTSNKRKGFSRLKC